MRSRPAVRSDEFAAAGKDAMAMGIPFTVAFAEIAVVAEPDQPRSLPPDELGFERIVYEKDYPRAP